EAEADGGSTKVALAEDAMFHGDLSLDVGRRRHEALVLALEQPRHLDAGAIAVLGADDLDAHGQTGLGAPRGRYSARQIRHARIARPEELIGGGYAPTVDLDGALVALAHVVMREGGGGCGGAEEEIVLLEELRPFEAHLVSRLVGGEPFTVR